MLSRVGSLWIARINEYLIKGRSFRDVKSSRVCSYAWRRLPRLRTIAYLLFRWQLGDGTSTLFWLDNWWDGCPLKCRFSQAYGIPPHATVAEVVRDARRYQRDDREGEKKVLQRIIHGVSLSDGWMDGVIPWSGQTTMWRRYGMSCCPVESESPRLNCFGSRTLYQDVALSLGWWWCRMGSSPLTGSYLGEHDLTHPVCSVR